MAKAARVLQVECVPDDVVKEHNIHYLLLATCTKYRNLVDTHVLYFMNRTFEIRKSYYEKIDENVRSYVHATLGHALETAVIFRTRI